VVVGGDHERGQSQHYSTWRDNIFKYEQKVMETLEFDLAVQSPRQMMRTFLMKTRFQPMPYADGFLDDSSFTMLWLMFPSKTIAALALYFAGLLSETEYPEINGQVWWKLFGVSMKDILKAASCWLDLKDHSDATKQARYGHLRHKVEDSQSIRTGDESSGSYDNVSQNSNPIPFPTLEKVTTPTPKGETDKPVKLDWENSEILPGSIHSPANGDDHLAKERAEQDKLIASLNAGDPAETKSIRSMKRERDDDSDPPRSSGPTNPQDSNTADRDRTSSPKRQKLDPSSRDDDQIHPEWRRGASAARSNAGSYRNSRSPQRRDQDRGYPTSTNWRERDRGWNERQQRDRDTYMPQRHYDDSRSSNQRHPGWDRPSQGDGGDRRDHWAQDRAPIGGTHPDWERHRQGNNTRAESDRNGGDRNRGWDRDRRPEPSQSGDRPASEQLSRQASNGSHRGSDRSSNPAKPPRSQTGSEEPRKLAYGIHGPEAGGNGTSREDGERRGSGNPIPSDGADDMDEGEIPE
jgi:hypothetical protein